MSTTEVVAHCQASTRNGNRLHDIEVTSTFTHNNHFFSTPAVYNNIVYKRHFCRNRYITSNKLARCVCRRHMLHPMQQPTSNHHRAPHINVSAERRCSAHKWTVMVCHLRRCILYVCVCLCVNVEIVKANHPFNYSCRHHRHHFRHCLPFIRLYGRDFIQFICV